MRRAKDLRDCGDHPCQDLEIHEATHAIGEGNRITRQLAKAQHCSDSALEFDRTGFLPIGIHRSSIEEARTLLTLSLDRHYIWNKLSRFLDRKVIDCSKFGAAYLAGNFISADPFVIDVDVILESGAGYTPSSYEEMEAQLQMGLDEIYQDFSVYLHFWAKGSPRPLDHPRLSAYSHPGHGERLKGEKRGIIQIPVVTDPCLAHYHSSSR